MAQFLSETRFKAGRAKPEPALEQRRTTADRQNSFRGRESMRKYSLAIALMLATAMGIQAQDVASATAKAAKDTGHATAKAAEVAGHSTTKAAKKTAHGTRSAAKTTVHGVKKGVKRTAHVVKKGGSKSPVAN